MWGGFSTRLEDSQQQLHHQQVGPFRLHHLSPVIGTEVLDIDMGAEHDADTVAFFAQLLVDRKVLFFREQNISVEQHIAFARLFGDLEVHPFTPNDATFPEVIHLDNGPDNKPSINVWHSDVTWRDQPSLGSILRARVVPEVGGDTLFANMEAAYDGLSEALKERLDGMIAIHDNQNFLNAMRKRGASEEDIAARAKQFPPSRHPVVRTHPISGRKSLYVNRAFTRSIEGLDEHASQTLLETLFNAAWIPDYQCRFRWQPDSFAFWDNRGAQHYAAADYFPAVRKMERVTIIGDKPY